MKLISRIISCALMASAIFAGALRADAQQDVITTVVGNGPNNIPALSANLYYPQQLAIDSQKNIYVADYEHHRVFKIGTNGIITLIAGNGVAGYSGDGKAATLAQLNYPQGVAVDGANPANVYIGDTNNCLVRKVSANTGVISTVAGLVTTPASGAPYASCGYSGDGNKASLAKLYYPVGLAINTVNSDLYIADYNNDVIRKVTSSSPNGTITTFAGNNSCSGSAPFGDTGLATQASLCNPAQVALDTTVSPANVFISDYNRCTVREVVGSSKKIYQVAGNYSCGFTDNVKATSGQINHPTGLALQQSGSTTKVTVADFYNYRIRQFSVSYSSGVPSVGNITTIAGNGSGFSGDGGPALSAGIGGPVGVVYDSSSNLYVAGQYDNRVRKITKSTNDIATIAGWGVTNYSDPIGVSNDAGGGVSLYQPLDVFADPKSTKVWIGGYYGQADYVYDSSSTKVTNFAGNGIAGYAGDGSSAIDPGTELYNPQGVVKDSSGNVFIADSAYCVIREVSASTGRISTVVGGTNNSRKGCGYSGDGGAATAAQIYSPSGLAIDSGNNLFIADYNNCLVRRVSHSTGNISTVAGLVTTVSGSTTASHCGYSGDGGSATKAQIYNVTGVAVDGSGNIYIADYQNHRIRKVDSATGIISTIAGNSNAGYTGDGPAIGNSLYYPQRVAADAHGNVFISDFDNYILRWVDPAGQMVTFAGTPRTAGFAGDNGVATSALLYQPVGITQDAGGNFYVADYNNQRIRKITAFAGYGRSTDSLNFGDTPSGDVSDYQAITLSAIGPVKINSISIPSGFSEIDNCAGQSFTAGQTCEIDVSFSPTSAGIKEGQLTISSNAFFAGQANNVYLTGHGTGLTVSGSLSFGTEVLKGSISKTVTLTNSGSSVSLSSITLTQTTDFSITGGSCPTGTGTLASGASCTITVSFKPQTTGGKKSTLVIKSSDPASPLLVGATGNGTAASVTPTSINFGSITHDTSTTTNVTVKNSGTASFTISTAFSGSGSSGYSISSTGKTCTSSLAAGASCILPVKFNPDSVTTYTATLTITTNGGSNPTVALTGSGK